MKVFFLSFPFFVQWTAMRDFFLSLFPLLIEDSQGCSNTHRWRSEDMDQRHVENARYLWTRFVEKNRRDVEEKSEQLKAISNLAALFAGFAVVTLTQFQFDQTGISILWIASYGVLTAIVVGLMTISMVSCTLILGSILKNGKTYVNEKAEEKFIFECHDFMESYTEGDCPPVPRRTFEKFWENRCEDDWRLAFQFFAWGVLCFLFSLIPIGWIKFSYSPLTAGLFAGVIAISIFVWGFSQYYWGSYLTSDTIKELLETHESRPAVKPVGLPFDWHITLANGGLEEAVDGQYI